MRTIPVPTWLLAILPSTSLVCLSLSPIAVHLYPLYYMAAIVVILTIFVMAACSSDDSASAEVSTEPGDIIL
jgi:prolipoprotein diacylglyceryltransferase